MYHSIFISFLNIYYYNLKFLKKKPVCLYWPIFQLNKKLKISFLDSLDAPPHCGLFAELFPLPWSYLPLDS